MYAVEGRRLSWIEHISSISDQYYLIGQGCFPPAWRSGAGGGGGGKGPAVAAVTMTTFPSKRLQFIAAQYLLTGTIV